MTRLFISDIDGCLAEAYRPFDIERFGGLAQRVARAGAPGTNPDLPAVTLCSGRAYAYVEAISQLLGLRTPMLFESGGGIFDPVAVAVDWHPNFTVKVEREIEAVRRWMKSEILPSSSLMYDYGKRTQAGIIGDDLAEVDRLAPVVDHYLTEHHPSLVMVRTSVSIDVVASGVTKLEGLNWLSGRIGIPLAEMAYIGDTHGDIPALQAVGASFAPANATDDVKLAVDVVTSAPVIAGVIEAYDHFARNGT